MKENKYDDEVFFQKYSEMERSKKGLAGAGEWPALKKLFPDVAGKRVLDLGCGYGWHCAYAAKQGAAYVLGVDISRKMLAAAKEICTDQRIQLQCTAMEDVCVPSASFDVVISSLAFHYVKEYAVLVRRIADWLKQGGELVFSVEHPSFTAYGSQDWYYDE